MSSATILISKATAQASAAAAAAAVVVVAAAAVARRDAGVLTKTSLNLSAIRLRFKVEQRFKCGQPLA